MVHIEPPREIAQERGMLKASAKCDFPGCVENFNATEGAKVARRRKDGKVVAYCDHHVGRLKVAGLQLNTLEEMQESARRIQEHAAAT